MEKLHLPQGPPHHGGPAGGASSYRGHPLLWSRDGRDGTGRDEVRTGCCGSFHPLQSHLNDGDAEVTGFVDTSSVWSETTSRGHVTVRRPQRPLATGGGTTRTSIYSQLQIIDLEQNLSTSFKIIVIYIKSKSTPNQQCNIYNMCYKEKQIVHICLYRVHCKLTLMLLMLMLTCSWLPRHKCI